MNKLISLKNNRRTIFTGDLHGDLDCLNYVLNKYQGNRLVFLGDYIDRGEHSKRVIDALLSLNKVYPEDIILLMGNHELGCIIDCNGDFWNLDGAENYIETFLNLPLAVEIGNIIAVHGGLPLLNKLSDINSIKIPDFDIGNSREDCEKFQDLIDITWGDFAQFTNGGWWFRPEFNYKEFEERISKFNKNVLIRGHQPKAPVMQFNNKLLTLITNNSCSAPRIAILEAGQEIKTCDELKIDYIR